MDYLTQFLPAELQQMIISNVLLLDDGLLDQYRLMSPSAGRMEKIFTLRLVCSRLKRLADRQFVFCDSKSSSNPDQYIQAFSRLFRFCGFLRLEMEDSFDYSVLSNFSQILHLSLSGHSLTLPLAQIESIRHLREIAITIRSPGVLNESGVSSLLSPLLKCCAGNLHTLEVAAEGEFNCSVLPLANLQSLSTLRIWYARVTRFDALQVLSSLRKLTVDRLQESEVRAVATLTSLTDLQLVMGLPKNCFLATYLSSLSSLERLSIPGIGSDEEVRYFAPFKKLTYLSGIHRNISQRALQCLSSYLPSVREFDCMSAYVPQSKSLNGVFSFTALRSLSIVSDRQGETLAEDSSFESLSSMVSLVDLHFKWQPIASRAMSAIASLTNLRVLILHMGRRTPLDSDSLIHMVNQLKQLVHLQFAYVPLRGAVLSSMRLESLRSLSLRLCELTSVVTLTRCTSLQYLDLSYNDKLQDKQLAVLSSLARLRALLLDHTKFNGQCFIGAQFASSLECLQNAPWSLREEPKKSELSTAGANAMADLLRVTELMVPYVGPKELRSLTRNGRHVWLELRFPSREHLAVVAENCTSLRELILRKVSVDAELVTQLRGLTRLRRLVKVQVLHVKKTWREKVPRAQGRDLTLEFLSQCASGIGTVVGIEKKSVFSFV